MNPFLQRLFLAVLLLGLWLIFAGSLDLQEVAVGSVAALLAALIAPPLPTVDSSSETSMMTRVVTGFLYIPYMLKAILEASLDVARRVVSPSLDINPGLVKVKTRLKNPIGRMILANSITLTPGTLTVDVIGEDLYIHWINVESDNIKEASETICAGFEHYLEVIFD
jgi:multicomponent Na+:H+ antiporter subunit E